MDGNRYLYDQVLLGQKRTCGKEFFEAAYNGRKEMSANDEKVVLDIVRYFIEYYMGWTPEEAMARLNEKLLEQFHLTSIIKQRIVFPLELSPMENLQYLVHRCYPNRFTYNSKQAIELYYLRVLNGKIHRFRKNFFAEEDGKGEERAFICFRVMLSQLGHFNNVREVYDRFNGPDARKILNQYKLGSACRDLFEFPIDFLHYSLPESQRDNLYYYRLRFDLVMSKQKKRERKQQRGKGICVV